MKQTIFILCLGLFIITTQSCDENKLAPIKDDGIPPGQVSNVKVKNLPGAAILTYTLPKDTDLLYVKAQYTARDGTVRESKKTYYDNSIKVVGFGDTSAHEVRLFAVDEGENESPPISIMVHPQKPPYQIVFDSLQTKPDFGGINVAFKNPGEDNIAIVVLANDTLGRFVPFNTNYTNLKTGDFSTRGFDSVETKFGIYIRDRWNNISDTLIVMLKPYFEMRLDRTKMKGVPLDGDAPLGYGGQVNYLFDGNTTDNGKHYYHTGDEATMPQWFTFDMGVKAKISRLTWWMRQSTGSQLFYYALHNPRNVEIWGSNDPPSDGSWNNWILLAKHEQIKPSGLPVGQLSQADMDAAEAGETITFPLNTPAVRYIRFKTLRNWSNGTYVNFDEIAIWGQPE